MRYSVIFSETGPRNYPSEKKKRKLFACLLGNGAVKGNVKTCKGGSYDAKLLDCPKVQRDKVRKQRIQV